MNVIEYDISSLCPLADVQDNYVQPKLKKSAPINEEFAYNYLLKKRNCGIRRKISNVTLFRFDPVDLKGKGKRTKKIYI